MLKYAIGLLFLLGAIPAAQAQTTYINPNGFGGYTAQTMPQVGGYRVYTPPQLGDPPNLTVNPPNLTVNQFQQPIR
jgi:hypothetical protein